MTDAMHHDTDQYGADRVDADEYDDVLATMERQFAAPAPPARAAHALHVLAQNGDEFTPTTARQLQEAPAELIDPLGRWIDPSDAAVLRGEVVLVIGWHSMTGEAVRGRAPADSETGRDWARVRRVFLRGA